MQLTTFHKPITPFLKGKWLSKWISPNIANSVDVIARQILNLVKVILCKILHCIIQENWNASVANGAKTSIWCYANKIVNSKPYFHESPSCSKVDYLCDVKIYQKLKRWFEVNFKEMRTNKGLVGVCCGHCRFMTTYHFSERSPIPPKYPKNQASFDNCTQLRTEVTIWRIWLSEYRAENQEINFCFAKHSTGMCLVHRTILQGLTLIFSTP